MKVVDKENIKIWLGDCVQVMREEMPEGEVSLVFTSPPYNVGIDYGVDYKGELIRDDKRPEDYMKLLMDFTEASMRVMKEGAHLVVNLPAQANYPNHPDPVILLGIEYVYRVVNSFPELRYRGGIPWIKGHSKMQNNGSLGVGSVANKPFPRDAYEMIYVFRYTDKRRLEKIPKVDKKFAMLMRNPWYVQPDNRRKEHRATFPLELVTNALHCFTVPNEVVLDPFMGTGTTLLGAINMGRIGWGIDISKEFVDMSIKKTRAYKSSAITKYL